MILGSIKKRLVEVMAEENVRAGEAVLRILERDPDVYANMTFGSEEDVVAFLKYPDTAITCDCGAAIANRGHPRYYGSFPKVLGHYVRDTRTLTIEDAIRKMTALPAAVIGMVDRGRLAPGMRADLTLFDPVTVSDHATFADPALPSEGVRHVIVNGTLVLQDAVPTQAKPGSILLRDQHMPSRQMTTAIAARSVTARAKSSSFAAELQIEQGSGQRYATGTVRLLDLKSNRLWTAQKLGVLQTAKHWASLTAVLRDEAGLTKAVTLTFDRGQASDAPVISFVLGNAPAVRLSGRGQVRPRIADRR